MKRVRGIGTFYGLLQELEEYPDPDQLEFPQLREDPPAADPRYDPLSDWLDEPFPEEGRA